MRDGWQEQKRHTINCLKIIHQTLLFHQHHIGLENRLWLHEPHTVNGCKGYLVDAVLGIYNLHLPVGMIDTVDIIMRLRDTVDVCLQEGIELAVVPVDVHGIVLGLCH